MGFHFSHFPMGFICCFGVLTSRHQIIEVSSCRYQCDTIEESGNETSSDIENARDTNEDIVPSDSVSQIR